MDVLPYGIAGFAALVMAFVGAVLSMDQGWYQGVVSKAVKPDGAELGWIFSLIFAVATFVPTRYLERKYTGR
jgi:purine-cytosine permease-like protein